MDVISLNIGEAHRSSQRLTVCRTNSLYHHLRNITLVFTVSDTTKGFLFPGGVYILEIIPEFMMGVGQFIYGVLRFCNESR